jgi:hypothetical protein
MGRVASLDDQWAVGDWRELGRYQAELVWHLESRDTLQLAPATPQLEWLLQRTAGQIDGSWLWKPLLAHPGC